MAIQDCNASLTTHIASIRMDFSILKKDVQNLRDRTGANEESVSFLEDVVHPLSAAVWDHTGEMAAFLAKKYDFKKKGLLHHAFSC